MKSTSFPVNYRGLFIHEYNTNDEEVKGDFFMIGHTDRDSYIDEEESSMANLTISKYQEILNRHEAKQYNHDIVYAKDDIKAASDSYFIKIEDAKSAIDELLSTVSPNKNKQILILTDEDNSYIPIAALIVDYDVNIAQIEEDIKEIKDSLQGKWTLSDIIDGLSIDFEDMSLECISL